MIFWLQQNEIEPVDARVDAIFEVAKQSDRLLQDEEIHRIVAQVADR